jgi:hypothetical protein
LRRQGPRRSESSNDSADKSNQEDKDPKVEKGSLRTELKGNESFCISHLVEAVGNTQNSLLTGFLNQMKVSVSAGVFSQEEMMTCLLVFLDIAGKSQKLLYAFEQLVPNKENMVRQSELSLDQEGIVKLFHCFLLSISTCLHYDETESVAQDTCALDGKGTENDSRTNCTETSKVSVSPDLQDPDKAQSHHHRAGWTLSEHVRRDILEIANYAASNLMQHVGDLSKTLSTSAGPNLKATKETTALSEDTHVNGAVDSSTIKKAPIRVSFQQFGEWYNKGGFSLVPWLELLDLNKWNVAGRVAEKAKDVNVVQEKQRANTNCLNDDDVTPQHQSSKEPLIPSNKNVASTLKEPKPSSNSSVPSHEEVESHVESSPSEKTKPRASNVMESTSTVSSHTENSMTPIPNEHTQQNSEQMSPLKDHSAQPPPPQDVPRLPVRNVLTFEFGAKKEFRLHLSEENVIMFDGFVQRTGLNQSSSTHVSNVLNQHAKPGNGIFQGISVIHRQDLPNVVRDLVPSPKSKIFTVEEMERFSNYFTIFFLSLARNANDSNFQSGAEQVIAKELAVGFSFLCAGNKSQKLDETFKIMSDNDTNILTQHKLLRFIRSYLRMILGISLLSKSPHVNKHNSNALLGINPSSSHISNLCYTTEVGSNWILSNFIQYQSGKYDGKKTGMDRIKFHDFADWYKNGGFTIAPWFELLDLAKLNGLLVRDIPSNTKNPSSDIKQTEAASPKKKANVFSPTNHPLNPPTSTGKIRTFDEFVDCFNSPNRKKMKSIPSNPQRQFNPDLKDILSTFPLTNGRNLIVLREDAAYVRSVVEQFGLLKCTPESVWNKLILHSKKTKSKPLPQRQASLDMSNKKSCELDQTTFVDGVMKSIPSKLRKKKSQPPLAETPKHTLENFFLSFDMNQVDRVAANQLMGGFSLFCSGSKTVKLSFIFSLFDDENEDDQKEKNSPSVASLSGKEMFYFFRSILIVLFSCCKQSLMLTAGPVGTYIADAANKVTNDVMRHQWKTRKTDRINFDEFGEWYNKGGYESAPWIELLDLEKWAFLDKDKAEKMLLNSNPDLDQKVKDDRNNLQNRIQSVQSPDRNADRSFFSPRVPNDDGFDPFCPDIGDMGDIGDIDCFDVDFGFDILPKVGDSAITDHFVTEASPAPSPAPYGTLSKNDSISSYPYQFKLSFDEKNHRIASVPPRRVQLLKKLLISSGLNEMDIRTMCHLILNAANGYKISRSQYDSAVEAVLGNEVGKNMDAIVKQHCHALFRSVFDQMVNFDGTAVTNEIICGLIVLCKGRKSEKLEFAFDILDVKKTGQFSRSQMICFLRSFLTVIFYISSCELGNEPAQNILLHRGHSFDDHLEDINIIMKVSNWVTDSVFKTTLDTFSDGSKEQSVSFDDFADWYTKGGHETNNWLELLDMEKWILSF